MTITLRDAHGRIASGGGGRTPGSRNRRSGFLVDHLPPDAFANIVSKLYELTLAGDVTAAKLLVDHYDPALYVTPASAYRCLRETGWKGHREPWRWLPRPLAAARPGTRPASTRRWP